MADSVYTDSTDTNIITINANNTISKSRFYAVRTGRTIGIFDNWDSCRDSVVGYKGKPKAEYKRFDSYDAAIHYMKTGCTDTSSANDKLTKTNIKRKRASNIKTEYAVDASSDSIINTNDSRICLVCNTMLVNDNGVFRCVNDICSNAVTEIYQLAELSIFSDGTCTIYKEPPNVHGHVVIYTDGCCLNNGSSDAKSGYGIFFGHQDPRNVSKRLPPNLIDAYGDYGSSVGTNQLAELYAIACALEICFLDANILKRMHEGYVTTTTNSNALLTDFNKEVTSFPKIYILTDSLYSILCLTKWYLNWQRNNWFTSKSTPVKYANLIKSILAQMSNLQRVRFIHVPAHVGIPGNEMADKLANIGANEN